MTFDLALVTLAASLTLYLFIAVISLWRRDFREREAYWLAFYASLAALWVFMQLGARLGRLAALRADFLAHLPLYGALTLAGVFVIVTRSFLRLSALNWTWRGLTALAIVLPILFDLNVLSLPDTLLSTRAWFLPRGNAAFATLVVVWGFFMALSLLLTARVHARTRQPLHRNRISYWVPVLGLMVCGDGLIFAGRTAIGGGLHLLGVCFAAYAVSTHYLLDVRRAARLALSNLLTAVLVVGLYVAGFVVLQTTFRLVPGYALLLAGAALAGALAFAALPLRRTIERTMNQIIPAAGYDPGRTVREYSQNIGNILDVDQLARVALGILQDTLGARHGALFLVDVEKGHEGDAEFCLRRVGDHSQTDAAAPGRLPASSPVAEYLTTQQQPLTQYDIDLLPRFRNTSPDERAWLTRLDMDVYVPIYSKSNWIGLLALGPKATRDRYFDDDLTLLSTLANQTTVALENARLVDNLVQLNRDLRKAYAALDQANQRLEHLDRTKSEFITVLSHELRTPLSLLLGYGQVLAEDPDLKARSDYRHLMDGLQTGTVRLKEIIESMLDMATIDTRTLKPYHAPAPLLPLIQKVCAGLEQPVAERKQSLEIRDELGHLPNVEADADLLGKVFHHLIVNAIKYTPDGGRIVISGRALKAGNARLPEGGAEVIVADTGIGIDPRFHELIFTKFYQTGEVATHSSGKTKFKGGGPGLGLAIVRGIVEAHGGKVWVESPGYDEETCPGSRFHVALPLRQTGRPPVEEPLIERQMSASGRSTLPSIGVARTRSLRELFRKLRGP
jgi:signal transduction histidine kinase